MVLFTRDETRFMYFLKLDETLMERLWGLTEMFPDKVRTAAEVSAQCSVSLAKKFYGYVSLLLI